MNKKGNLHTLFFILIISLIVSIYWDKIPYVKDFVHSILDPTAGSLIIYNHTIGMLVIIVILNFFLTILYKYTTDQKRIKEIKEEQKKIQNEMKKFRDNPKKVMELQQKILPLSFELMKHSLKPTTYSLIPILFLFRWFNDLFNTLGNPKFLGIFNWLWFYLIASIFVSILIRKILKAE